jgi:ATP/ADP translocase
MTNRIQGFLKLKPDEWKLALSMLLLLAINTLVFELAQVVATSGFVSSVGAKQLPWVWIVDMIALLVLGGIYAQMVDRISRAILVGWLMGSFALIYLVIQLLFSYGAPDWLNYTLLLITSDQQFLVFPLAFWALASDVYSISQSKRLFPFVGAGFALGSISGNGLAASSAAIFARFGGEIYQLLNLAAVILLVGLAIHYFTFHQRELRTRKSRDLEIDVRESIEVGVDFFRNVPFFKYLGIVILLAYLGYTIIQFHFLNVLDKAFASELGFQSFYGTYKVVLIISTLFVQWVITGRLLQKIDLKNSFSLFPISIVMAATSGLVIVGVIGGAIGVFLIELVERAWDQPARKTLQGFIPDERRGRVTTFFDSYLLAITTILASIFLLLLNFGWSYTPWPNSILTVVYLSVAVLASGGAILAAFKARAEYDQSMLNWRLSRRQRKGLTGVMDKLEF